MCSWLRIYSVPSVQSYIRYSFLKYNFTSETLNTYRKNNKTKTKDDPEHKTVLFSCKGKFNTGFYIFSIRLPHLQHQHLIPPLHPTGHDGCRCIEARSVVNVILTTVSPNRVMYGESRPRQFAGSLRGSFVKGSSLLG